MNTRDKRMVSMIHRSYKKVKGVYFHKIILIAICFIFVLSTVIWGNRGDISSAHTESGKGIKSVLVCQGDTLWSIAKTYHTESNGDIKKYIDEIRNINHLKSDFIRSGNYILIPYFEKV